MIFVRADTLGEDDKKEIGSSRYLHAKGLFVRVQGGESIFVSGSANPSAPAWLAEGAAGNVELMLVRRGNTATITAKEMGFASITQMPLLQASDWATIAENRKEVQDDAKPLGKVGLAVVEGEQVFVDLGQAKDFLHAPLALLGLEGQEITRTIGFKQQKNLCIATFPLDKLITAVRLRCLGRAGQQAEFLLHHVREVEEHARTGVQKRFKDALLSLQTDSPNIGLLIDCIDKIIFSDASKRGSVIPKSTSGRDHDSVDENQEHTSLAIDVSETKKRKSKIRLTHSGDFAYLLDALIYHLRLEQDKRVEDLDHFGRSEEEQVGSDDEEDDESHQMTGQRRVDLLKFCHSKVHTVVNRMIAQLRAYATQKQPLGDVLVRLLGVLAVLRELRGCDGRVQWVEKGKTTVPHEERRHLFDEIMYTLFEGKTSLLHLNSLGEEFTHSDDVARLKGLLVWLAWDCGLVLDLQKPFMESLEQLETRLRRNAMMLALAQAVETDNVVIDEARQSIGSLSASEMDWLKSFHALARQCDAIRRGDTELHTPDDAKPGDIALHKTIKNWDLRIVKSSARIVSLVKLVRTNDVASYTPDYLMIARLN